MSDALLMMAHSCSTDKNIGALTSPHPASLSSIPRVLPPVVSERLNHKTTLGVRWDLAAASRPTSRCSCGFQIDCAQHFATGCRVRTP